MFKYTYLYYTNCQLSRAQFCCCNVTIDVTLSDPCKVVRMQAIVVTKIVNIFCPHRIELYSHSHFLFCTRIRQYTEWKLNKILLVEIARNFMLIVTINNQI